ncbi:MAG TPA: outer membrane beta-barrel protein [Gemmatimonadales bacterium]|nr:outer membrane beta-barrel protein [Gemmatimonadales bacterium]
MPTTRPLIALMLLALAAAPAVTAQGRDRELTISLAGITSADLEVINESGARERVAQLVAGTPVTVARSGLLGKTRRTTVQVQRTGEDMVVLLGPGGARDEQCNRIPPGSLDECQTIGVFINRPGAEFRVDAAGGVINLITNSPYRRGRAGFEAAYNRFTRLDSVACSDSIAGLTQCSVEDSRLSTGIFAEYDLNQSLALSARLGIGKYRVDQVYGGTNAVHDVSVKSVDLSLQYRFGDGPVTPFLGFGPSMYFNRSEITRDGAGLDGRSESGIRVGGGAGIDFGFGARFFGRAQGSYWSGGSDDADTNLRFAFGAGLNF